MPEHLGVSIKDIRPGNLVEKQFFLRTSKKRIGMILEIVLPCLEQPATDLKLYSLAWSMERFTSQRPNRTSLFVFLLNHFSSNSVGQPCTFAVTWGQTEIECALSGGCYWKDQLTLNLLSAGNAVQRFFLLLICMNNNLMYEPQIPLILTWNATV